MKLGDIGICTPFYEKYDLAEICLEKSCHTHLFMGGDVSYIITINMNNKGSHLGLTLVKGSLASYSLERDFALRSGDRGDFILHPSAFSLCPHESYTIEWVVFLHEGESDFYKQAAKYSKMIEVELNNWVAFTGEAVHAKVKPRFDYNNRNVTIKINNKDIKFTFEENNIIFDLYPEKYQELVMDIDVDGRRIQAKSLVQLEFDKLIEQRCRFISEKQQYNNDKSELNGAYLIYDNETKDLYYEAKKHDHNAVRERMVMGMLMALYLQHNKDEKMSLSLQKYLSFVINNRFDIQSGKVMNDFTKMKARDRKYNYPWFIQLMIESYKVYGNKTYLNYAMKAIRYFYTVVRAQEFCAPTLFICEIIETFKNAGMQSELEESLNYFIELADEIAAYGIYYPKHEVKYEVGIVAPGVHIEMQVYKLTGNEKYLKAAIIQLNLLGTFSAHQPNYHLYETAIRHWDGYWFGKCQCFGDTFPHYWSAESGIAYKYLYEYSKKEIYKTKMKDSLRSCLSLFYPDGSATCAYMFPFKVNGQPLSKPDAWANDQDFAMYYYAKFMFYDN